MQLNFSAAKIDSNGTTYRYFDSGTPCGGKDDYTTVVMFHGSMTNANTFQPLLPFARRLESKLRLILVHRRGYGGIKPSTPWSDEEVKDCHDGKDSFLKIQAQDLGNLVAWIIDHLRPKPISEDGKAGGLAILGYSIASTLTFSLLGHADALVPEVYEKVNKYLRKFIVYDAPMLAFGYDIPSPDAWGPFLDDSIANPRTNARVFGKWATRRYSHLNPRSLLISGLDITTKEGRVVERESDVEFGDPQEAFRTDFGFMPYPGKIQGMLRRQKDNAMFGEGNKDGKLAFPDVGVVYQCCLDSIWVSIWGCRTMTREVHERKQREKQARKTDFINVEGATHMYHWDEPRKYFEVLQRSVYDY